MLLDIRRLSKSFGSVKAADGVDLTVARGEAVGIIGPNGAGKTTLFNLITGNLEADGGEIRLDGVDVTRLPAHKRCAAGIGRAYQIPHPFENMTVFENLLVAAVHGRGGHLRRHPGGHRPDAARQHAGRHPHAARTQAPGDGPRLGHGAAASAARRDRRRADGERVPGAGRHHQGDPRRRHHDRLDRAHRARIAGRGRPPGRPQLRPQDRRGQPVRRYGLRRGPRDLHRRCSRHIG
jgi:ABC-type Fe3+/spermidine/putrescine transport system ATPase subunit